jgi:hypothetical protein
MAEDARQASLDWSPPGISDLDPYSQSAWSLVWSHRVQVEWLAEVSTSQTRSFDRFP